MGDVTTELKKKPVDSKTWELLGELRYSNETRTYTVPRGFRTDLATIPRIFWGYLPPFGNYIEAAVIHDFLYGIHGHEPRKAVDDLFLEMMLVSGVRKSKAWLMYIGVRAFGWLFFKEQR